MKLCTFFVVLSLVAQIAMTLRLTSIRYRSDTYRHMVWVRLISNGHMDINLRLFTTWVWLNHYFLFNLCHILLGCFTVTKAIICPYGNEVTLKNMGQTDQNQTTTKHKYSLLMHCIKIKSRAKSLLNEQYVFVGGNISFLCVLSCISEEA